MEKTSKATGRFIGVMILLATLFQGSFFAVEYIAVTIAFIVFIICSKEVSASKSTFGLLFGVVLMYYLSAMFSGYDTGEAVSEATRPLLLLAAALFGLRLEKNSFMKSLIIASVVLGGIGLLSLCRIVEFKDFVYVYDGVRSLQSTMQYANSAAVMLICGVFAVRAMQRDGKHSFVYAVAEMSLTVCLLFTHSKIAIGVYVLLTIAELLLMREGISRRFVLSIASSLILYFSMEFLIERKLSFVALMLCIIAVLLVAERISAMKNTTVTISRPMALLLVGGVVIVMAAALRVVDISTIMIRFLYYSDGMKALIQNPLFGLSPGGWAEYQYNYQSAQYFVSKVHNGILQVGLDAGIPAMLLFISLLVITFAGLIKRWHTQRRTNDLYILLIYTTLIFHGLFDFDFSYGNILIVLGICVSYGSEQSRVLYMKMGYRLLSGFCIVLLIFTGVSRTLAFFGDIESKKENYEKADACYESACRLTFGDIDSVIEQSLCHEKLGYNTSAAEIVDKAFDKHPNNRDIIMKAMAIAVGKKDFSRYIEYQYRLLECAPMQQTTYSDSIRYLDEFHRSNVIDDTLYLKEKHNIITNAVDANKRMSAFREYLDFGAEIDISALK